MALLGSWVQQPAEHLPVDISYSTVIGGRTVTSITTMIIVPAGMVKDSEQISGENLQIYCSGGTDGTTYRWTVRTDIVIGGKTTTVEDEFDIIVEAT